MALLLVAALVGIILATDLALGTKLPLALGLGAAFVLIRVRRRRPSTQAVQAGSLRDPSPPGPRRAYRGLELTGDRLCFRSESRTQLLLTTSSTFGVTVLSTPERDRVLVLLSSSLGTFSVGARLERSAATPKPVPGRVSRPERPFGFLFDRAITVGTEDAGLEAIGPDGAPLLLAPDDVDALVGALVGVSPSCLERFVLTDARAQKLTLDGRTLAAGDRSFDLSAPIDWRSIVFQETFGQAAFVYQGTWIRQSGAEVVVVCLLPSLGPAVGPDLDLAALDRAALRDLRLMQASPEEPPPPEQRVAIERLFMLPLRSALSKAPRVSSGMSKKSASP